MNKTGASVDAPVFTYAQRHPRGSENRVDERGERGSFGESEEASYEQKNGHERNEPESLALSHEPKQLRRSANNAHGYQTIQRRL